MLVRSVTVLASEGNKAQAMQVYVLFRPRNSFGYPFVRQLSQARAWLFVLLFYVNAKLVSWIPHTSQAELGYGYAAVSQQCVYSFAVYLSNLIASSPFYLLCHSFWLKLLELLGLLDVL